MTNKEKAIETVAKILFELTSKYPDFKNLETDMFMLQNYVDKMSGGEE